MYDYTISFKPSSLHSNADALSRIPLVVNQEDPSVPAETILLLETMSESPVSVEKVRSWTSHDLLLSEIILSGWPSHQESTEKLN